MQRRFPVSIAMSLAASTSRRHALGTEPAEVIRNVNAFASLGEARAAMEMVAREVLPANRT